MAREEADRSAGGAQIKGTVLRARLKYISERSGPGGLDSVLGRLPEEDQRTLRGLILPVGWYPLTLNVRLDEAIADVFSPGDRTQVFRDLGRASAETNLNGVHRHLVHAGDPHYLLARAQDILRFYYDVGRRTYEKIGPGDAVLRTYDLPGVSAIDCLSNLGWHERAIEISGGRNVRVTEPTCRGRGGLHCEYRCHWD